MKKFIKLLIFKRLLIMFLPILLIFYLGLAKYPYSYKNESKEVVAYQNIPPGWNLDTSVVTHIDLKGLYLEKLQDVIGSEKGTIIRVKSSFGTSLVFISEDVLPKIFYSRETQTGVVGVYTKNNNIIFNVNKNVFKNLYSFYPLLILYSLVYLCLSVLIFLLIKISKKPK